MCDYDNDPCQIFHPSWRTARKGHRCCECNRHISAGERYEVTDSMFDGRWDYSKTCEHCVAARQFLVVNCGGAYMLDQLAEDLIEHWREEDMLRSVWLARCIHGMTRRWARKDGSLLPVPASYQTLAGVS